MNFPENWDQNLSVFFTQFCDIAKVAIISHEDLLKFGNNQDMKVKIIIPKISSCLHVSF
jgi:hypothetical protein